MYLQALPVLNNKKTVKDHVIFILSHEWPLTLKKLYMLMRKRYQLEVSYQACHKAVRELLDQKILEKNGKEYQLNAEWISSIHDYGEKMKYAYSYLSKMREPLHRHKNIKFFENREGVINNLIPIFQNSTKGDITFGHNKSGMNYPKKFYEEVEKAAARGAIMKFIIPKESDSLEFVEMIHKIKAENIEIRTTTEDYIRVCGTKSKEVMFALPYADHYFGVHFIDPRISNYMYLAFLSLWERTKPYE